MNRKAKERLALGVAGVAVGIFVAMMLGVTVVIAAVMIVGSWWVLTRMRVHRRLVFPVAFLIGHALWMVTGLIALAAIVPLSEAVALVGPDIVLMAGLAAWILVRPSASAFYAVVIYEVLSIAISFWFQMAAPTQLLLLVSLHAVVRIATIVGAALALRHRVEFAPAAPAPTS